MHSFLFMINDKLLRFSIAVCVAYQIISFALFWRRRRHYDVGCEDTWSLLCLRPELVRVLVLLSTSSYWLDTMLVNFRSSSHRPNTPSTHDRF